MRSDEYKNNALLKTLLCFGRAPELSLGIVAADIDSFFSKLAPTGSPKCLSLTPRTACKYSTNDDVRHRIGKHAAYL